MNNFDGGAGRIPAGMEDVYDDMFGGGVNGGDPNFNWDLADLNVEDYGRRLLDLENFHDDEFDADFYDDHDFFSDYDDDEWGMGFYSDSDEAADRSGTVFNNLQDAAHVLPKIMFRKSVAPGDGRRPPLVRIQLASEKYIAETYESLFRVLEELEVMLRVWKRRTEHPFTAHIVRPEGQGELDGSVVDFSGTDIESDDQDIATNQAASAKNTSTINESLTKRKYCESTKIFHSIFDNDMELDQLIGSIKKKRKYVQNVIFNMFLDSLGPDNYISRLPAELREKIWKLTQVPFEDDSVYHVGLRSPKESIYLEIEKERITDMFGAAGNLHILLFEILFSQPHHLKPSTMVFLETVDRRKPPYGKEVFHKWLKLFNVSYQRLKAFEHLDFKNLDSLESQDEIEFHSDMESGTSRSDVDEDEITEQPLESHIAKGIDVVTKFDRGMFEIKSNKSTNKSAPTRYEFNDRSSRMSDGWHLLSCGTEDSCSRYYASVYGDERANDDGNVKINIHDVLRDKLVAVINSDISLIHVLSNACGSVGVFSQSLSLYKNQLAIIHTETRENEEICKISRWKWEDRSFKVKKLKESHSIVVGKEDPTPPRSSCRKLKTTMLADGKIVYLVVQKGPEKLVITLLDDESGEVIDKVIYDHVGDGHMEIKSLKDNMLLLSGENKLILLDLNTRCEVVALPFPDFCKKQNKCCRVSGGATDQCNYTAKFDLKQDANRFIIYSQNMSYFKIFEYKNLESGEVELKVSKEGAFNFLYQMGGLTLDCTLFWGNVMLLSPSLGQRSIIDDCMVIRLYCLNLENKSLLPLISVTTDGGVSEQTLNDCHKSIFLEDHIIYDPGKMSNILQIVNNDTVLLTFGEKAYVTVKLHQSHVQVLKEEAKSYKKRKEISEKSSKQWSAIEKRLKSDHAKQKKTDAERVELIKRISEKYLNKTEDQFILRGKIHSWKPSKFYGFVRPVGEAKDLGNLFVHASEIVNKSKKNFPRNNRWIEFHAREDADKLNYRAVNVKLTDPPKNTGSTDGSTSVESTQSEHSKKSKKGGDRGQGRGRGSRKKFTSQ